MSDLAPRRRTLRIPRLLPLLLLGACSPIWANGPVPRDQSDIQIDFDGDISSDVQADDFVLSSAVYLTSADVWLVDNGVGDNGVLDSFGGELSWAIYEDSGGVPGSLLASGSAAGLEGRDVGFQRDGDYDLFRYRFDFDVPPSLDAGTYWLALHEGAWGSHGDGSQVWWLFADSTVGTPHLWADDPTSPGEWQAFTYGDAHQASAFVLYGKAPAWDQAGISSTNDFGISSWTRAADLTFATSTTLSSMDVFLADDTVNDNGVLDTFDGTLAWALFTDGDDAPDTLLRVGSDSSVGLTDSGLQDAAGHDIVRARLRFDPPFSLSSGVTRWLALHEGASWNSASDGSEVRWISRSPTIGLSTAMCTISAGCSTWSSAVAEVSFVLFEEVVFASGFEAGTACAWLDVDGGLCP